MDISFITRLLDLVQRSNISELDLTLDGARLRVVRKHDAAGNAPAAPFPAPGDARTSAPVAAQPTARKLHAVKAGFPGTFYRAPAPGAAPFVVEGDVVEDGKQLAIVEAMKTMNPVEADAAGTIMRIAVEDAQPVEAGDLLFEIDRHGR